MKYSETKPESDCVQYIECYWQFHADNIPEGMPTHVIVPDGAVSLSYILLPNKKAFVSLTGPSLKAHKVSLVPGAVYAGIRILPGIAGSVLGANISDYRDMFGPQVEQLPQLVKLMQEQIPDPVTQAELPQLLHAATQLIAEHAEPLDDAVRQFAKSIMQADGNANLADLSASLGVGLRQLRRRFKIQCGLTPKEFSRLRRVRKACIYLLAHQDLPLAVTASQAGFSDQAHMSREFSNVFENSTKLVEEYLKQIAHGTLVESAG